MLQHVLTIRGNTAAADGARWTVDPSALLKSEGERLFAALFPRGPGRKWYRHLSAAAPLFIDADDALDEVEWETLTDRGEIVDLTRGVVRVVAGSAGRTLMNLAAALEMLQREEDAVACHDAAIRELRNARDDEALAVALVDAAFLTHELVRLDEAQEYYGQALEVARRIGDSESEALALNGLAGIHDVSGRPVPAEQCHRAAVELSRRGGSRATEGRFLCDLAVFLLGRERLPEAAECLEQALALGRRESVPDVTVAANCALARLHQVSGKTAAAVEAVCTAMEVGLQHDESDVIDVTGTALDMAAAAAADGDWALVTAIADGLGKRLEAALSQSRVPEDALASAGASAVICGVMAALGGARGDASHHSLSRAPEVLEEVDAATDDAFGLVVWLDDMCGRSAGGSRRI